MSIVIPWIELIVVTGPFPTGGHASTRHPSFSAISTDGFSYRVTDPSQSSLHDSVQRVILLNQHTLIAVLPDQVSQYSAGWLQRTQACHGPLLWVAPSATMAATVSYVPNSTQGRGSMLQAFRLPCAEQVQSGGVSLTVSEPMIVFARFSKIAAHILADRGGLI